MLESNTCCAVNDAPQSLSQTVNLPFNPGPRVIALGVFDSDNLDTEVKGTLETLPTLGSETESHGALARCLLLLSCSALLAACSCDAPLSFDSCLPLPLRTALYQCARPASTQSVCVRGAAITPANRQLEVSILRSACKPSSSPSHFRD